MRLAWLTDIHLDFLETPQIADFLADVHAQHADALVISGDIGEADSVTDFLRQIAAAVRVPVYFVLGNHDYYRGSIGAVRTQVAQFCRSASGLVWLNQREVVSLTPDVALVGHDGWSDGRCGDYLASDVRISDYRRIAELCDLTPAQRLPRLQALADEAGDHLRRVLPSALASHLRVFVVVHPVPFREACIYEGRVVPADNPRIPHFTSKAIGDVLLDMANQYPHRQLTVLCGHIHIGGDVLIRDNLRVLIGKAQYRQPVVQKIFTL